MGLQSRSKRNRSGQAVSRASLTFCRRTQVKTSRPTSWQARHGGTEGPKGDPKEGSRSKTSCGETIRSLLLTAGRLPVRAVSDLAASGMIGRR